ncbi:unnamed protein product [Leptosia nina]|uniref:Secreted protein n=1 Tax=Leptosia nina TaxID=320188 RepID=A0AAV1J6N2_9NEOP
MGHGETLVCPRSASSLGPFMVCVLPPPAVAGCSLAALCCTSDQYLFAIGLRAKRRGDRNSPDALTSENFLKLTVSCGARLLC